MDKATQKSIEWQKANNSMAIGGDAFTDMVDSFNVNSAFVAGYKEAEKDLALSWEDIQTILNIENDIFHECCDSKVLIINKYPKGEYYYGEILK